jgi:hypothetical protein
MTLPDRLTDSEIEVVTEALTDRPGWLELARSLESAADEQDSQALRMLSMAFVYDLVAPGQSDRRATAGGPYATMCQPEKGPMPALR